MFIFLKNIINVLITPSKFYDELNKRTEKDVIIYLAGLTILVQSFNYGLSFFIKNYSQYGLVKFIGPKAILYAIPVSLLIMYGISVLIRLPVEFMRGRHMSKEEKKLLKTSKEARKKFNKKSRLIFAAVGYGITPIILFTYPFIVFSGIKYIEILFYLSLYWIWLCIIGISKLCGITKLESGITLIIPALIVTMWLSNPDAIFLDLLRG